jgi:LmbE family N-acetylglucosaminyl deacetylase
MNTEEKILIIAAHPDDEVLGCGGIIAKYRSLGVLVRIVFLAEGVTARYNEHELQLPHVLNDIDQRNKNAFIALDILSVPRDQVFISERLCCRLDSLPQIDIVKQIEFHIAEWQPTSIYTHSPNDVNVDHRVAYKVVLAATRPVKSSSVKALYSFEVLSSTEWNVAQPFQANTFVDISDFIELKVKALSAYKGEINNAPHPRSKEVIHALARYRGAQSGLNFAEAFNLIRLVKS